MSILKLTSDTLVGTPATGNIEYNGQFFATDNNNSRAQMQRLVQGTAVASTSGTSIDFTGIPAWAKKITVMFNGVSTSGTSNLLIQVGDSGGIETTGYASTVSTQSGATTANSTSGFIIAVAVSATSLHSGIVTLANIDSTSWVSNGLLKEGTTTLRTSAGDKSLSDILTQVRITTVNGTDTFDAGTINILYEG
jgi:hypothetical protein